MSRLMTKPTKWHVRPAKTQIRPVLSESSPCAQWVAKNPSFLHADSADSDQTGRMPRLIWVFAGRTCHFVGFLMRWLISYSILVNKMRYMRFRGSQWKTRHNDPGMFNFLKYLLFWRKKKKKKKKDQTIFLFFILVLQQTPWSATSVLGNYAGIPSTRHGRPS